jgi:hypothetical protein
MVWYITGNSSQTRCGVEMARESLQAMDQAPRVEKNLRNHHHEDETMAKKPCKPKPGGSRK